jgi:hypothetical protein
MPTLLRALTAALVATTMVAPTSAVADDAARVCARPGRGCAFTSVQAAIDAAHNSQIIVIAPGTYHENVHVGATSPTPLTLVAQGDGRDEEDRDDRGRDSDRVAINGGQRGSVLTIASGHVVRLIGLRLTNGAAPNGGGIDNEGGTLWVIKSLLDGNRATGTGLTGQGFGGGLFNNNGTLLMVSTRITANTAARGAGLVTGSPSGTGSATLHRTRVDHNLAGAAGGGILNCGMLEVTSSQVRENTAGQGGGLTNCGPVASGAFGRVRLVNSRISDNHALGGTSPEGDPLQGHGGGISNAGVLTLIGTAVTDNTAPPDLGGGIFNQGGTVSPTHSTVRRNTPPQCVGTACLPGAAPARARAASEVSRPAAGGPN